ncbi:hypothetical protein GQ472_01655 [archaeon]|nr:hypothetical protein [archaeon]
MVLRSHVNMMLALVVMLVSMSGTSLAYVELLDYSSSPLMTGHTLILVVHQFTLGYQLYTNETIDNCTVDYAYMIYEPYKLTPLTFIRYDTVVTVLNKTDVIADNVTWNYITVTLPVKDEAESRYIADLVCTDSSGDYVELGCVSGCLLPETDGVHIYDYTERETTFKNVIAGSGLGEIPAGFVLGLSENVSITEAVMLLIILAVLSTTVVVVNKIFK